MNNKVLVFLLLFLGGTLFLLPNFYHNRWKAVDPVYYDEWQIRYDRLVIARLVKTRQDGFFSAGGFMGLGDASEWNFLSTTHSHQFDTYFDGGEFESYLVYKSNPGFQGLLYGSLDQLLNIGSEQKVRLFRGCTALLSAATLSLIFSAVVIELGIISGLLMLLFAAFSTWTILPAGSIFWNLWAFYLPFIVSGYLLTRSSKKNVYNAFVIHTLLFASTLLRILLSGFDIITTGMVMTTVPFVYYAIKDKWTWNLFVGRFIKSGLAILMGAMAALLIMSAQIIANDEISDNAFSYILNRFGHHFGGNSEIYVNEEIEPTKISALEITSKYLNVSALTIRVGGKSIDILYWHLVMLFAVFTLIFILRNRDFGDRKAQAFLISTWYSILAPFSWYLIFKPHSIIHTHVNSMGWQMPFALLGFALCGYVITDLTKKMTYKIER